MLVICNAPFTLIHANVFGSCSADGVFVEKKESPNPRRRQEVAAKISKSPPRLADDKKTVVGGGNLELGDDGGVMQFYLLNI